MSTILGSSPVLHHVPRRSSSGSRGDGAGQRNQVLPFHRSGRPSDDGKYGSARRSSTPTGRSLPGTPPLHHSISLPSHRGSSIDQQKCAPSQRQEGFSVTGAASASPTRELVRSPSLLSRQLSREGSMTQEDMSRAKVCIALHLVARHHICPFRLSVTSGQQKPTQAAACLFSCCRSRAHLLLLLWHTPCACAWHMHAGSS